MEEHFQQLRAAFESGASEEVRRAGLLACAALASALDGTSPSALAPPAHTGAASEPEPTSSAGTPSWASAVPAGEAAESALPPEVVADAESLGDQSASAAAQTSDSEPAPTENAAAVAEPAHAAELCAPDDVPLRLRSEAWPPMNAAGPMDTPQLGGGALGAGGLDPAVFAALVAKFRSLTPEQWIDLAIEKLTTATRHLPTSAHVPPPVTFGASAPPPLRFQLVPIPPSRAGRAKPQR